MAKKKSSQAPAAPAPIDYGALAAAASATAGQQAAAMAEAQAAAYERMLASSLAATDTISGKLNNSYTAAARAQTDQAMAQIPQMQFDADQIRRLAAQADSDVAGTEIERMLRLQAERDLALGRTLSPEEQREASQAARSAYSARGLAMGQPAATVEVLARNNYATAREDARRAFAGNVNQMLTQNRTSRIGLAGGLYGESARVRTNAGQLGLAGAGTYTGIDPYQRALQSNLPGQVLNASTQFAGMVGDTYNNAAQLAGQVAGFNTNMQGSIYNSWMNNQAALRGAQLQAGATSGASNNALMGSGMAAGGALLGTAAVAIAI